MSSLAGALSIAVLLSGGDGLLLSVLAWIVAVVGCVVALAQVRLFWMVLGMDPVVTGRFQVEERWASVPLLTDEDLRELLGEGANSRADEASGVRSLFVDGNRVGSVLVARAPSPGAARRYVRRQARWSVDRGVGVAPTGLGDAAVYTVDLALRGVKVAAGTNVLCVSATADVATASIPVWQAVAHRALDRLTACGSSPEAQVAVR
ncbi:hypothetical protein [Planotetraspora sp. GP83]|uniref:hypothetical protein n=1 Tax=Planotetraspora sp. GP83 TaxID=3156264 RepID=UPI00351557B3